jgi:hypothetical protein
MNDGEMHPEALNLSSQTWKCRNANRCEAHPGYEIQKDNPGNMRVLQHGSKASRHHLIVVLDIEQAHQTWLNKPCVVEARLFVVRSGHI